MLIGPVEPKHEPRLFTPITKNRLVSSGLPGPTMLSHQPMFFRFIGIKTGHMMGCVERMTDEHGVRPGRV